MLTMNIAELLEFEEGFRSQPYLCSEGFVTIGFGTKLHSEKGIDPEGFPLDITRETGMALLSEEIGELHNRLMSGENGKPYDGLSSARKIIVLSMAYQLGYEGLMEFKITWKHLRDGKWQEASEEMLRSEWFREDTPDRALRHSVVVRTGQFKKAYAE